MCQFFSFIFDENGKMHYFNAKQRLELLKDNPKQLHLDSHASIAAFFKLDEDKCNKYEYLNGELIEDNIVHDLKPNNFDEFANSKEFQEICIAVVKQDGEALRCIKEQTPKICLAAVKQSGWALKFVKKQTPKICIAAVKQDGCALQFVKPEFKHLFE
jgi:hypothetical protein